MDDRAGLFRPGWIAKLLVYGVGGVNCKGGVGRLVVLLLAERARSEGARSTRAIEDRPGCPLKEAGDWEDARGEGDKVERENVPLDLVKTTLWNYLAATISRSSTSKINVEPGLIVGGAPLSP